ncbi:MAG TPA: thioesterase, partial [Candidatus Udaeobacter sp.]|nr:thioesterase [Candidatus Udaeobacter sp.]
NLLEHAAHAVMLPHLAPGAATVGTGVDVRHLAATPPGMRVRAKAVLRETDGRRYLFEVEAWDDVEKIAEGRHERVMVADLAPFLERANAKRRDQRP